MTTRGPGAETPTQDNGAQEERRGDRRTQAQGNAEAGGAWRCRGLVNVVTGGHATGPKGTKPCASTDRREDPETGKVYCGRCGHVDRRSTVGNRRRARQELAALERRIERELEAVNRRVDAAAAVSLYALQCVRVLIGGAE